MAKTKKSKTQSKVEDKILEFLDIPKNKINSMDVDYRIHCAKTLADMHGQTCVMK